jgi:outer membrane biogenesis lipoprotein LolB
MRKLLIATILLAACTTIRPAKVGPQAPTPPAVRLSLTERAQLASYRAYATVRIYASLRRYGMGHMDALRLARALAQWVV